MRRSSELAIKFTVLLCLLFFTAAVFLRWEKWWGYNHAIFLDDWVKYLISGAGLIVIYFLFAPIPEEKLDNFFVKLNKLFFDSRFIPFLLVASFLTCIFIIFRVQTFFLGDGYTCIGIFENTAGYIHKYTEFLSSYIIRLVQTFIGDYSKESSLLAFRLSSFFFGFITIFMLLLIIRDLYKSVRVRFLATATLLFSGSILMFFGYVEFYPMLWGAVSIFLWSLVRFFKLRKGLIWVIASFLICIGVHIQALYLIGGVVVAVTYQFYNRKAVDKLPGKIYVITGGLALAGLGVFIWKVITKTGFALYFLPLFSGRPRTPGYAIFSLDHLFDILNETILIYPGILILPVIWFVVRKKANWKNDYQQVSLFFMSCGAALFILVIEPYIGMARDWDLMSLTILLPALLILYLIDKNEIELSSSIVIPYFILCLLLTTTFLGANISITSSEERYASLLKIDNDNRSRNGWLILTNYYYGMGEKEKADGVIVEMNRRFPQYVFVNKAYGLIDKGLLPEAYQIAESLLKEDPYNIRFIELMGNIHLNYQRYSEAEKSFLKALEYNPYSISVKNFLGRLYIMSKQNQKAVKIFEELLKVTSNRPDIVENLALAYINVKDYEKVSYLSDSLFQIDRHSPVGHLIMLNSLVNRGDKEKAKYYFEQFKEYGIDHPDYEMIMTYFNPY